MDNDKGPFGIYDESFDLDRDVNLIRLITGRLE